MDPVFSYEDVESACLEDSVDTGEPYTGSLVIRESLGPGSAVLKEENTRKSTALKKPPKKSFVSCFSRRKRHKDGK